MELPITILEIFDGTAVMKLPINDFEKLNFDDKMIVYHLWHAAVIGDSITYDQSYRYGLKLRDLFLELCSKKEEIVKASKENKSINDIYDTIEEYTKNILIHQHLLFVLLLHL